MMTDTHVTYMSAMHIGQLQMSDLDLYFQGHFVKLCYYFTTMVICETSY